MDSSGRSQRPRTARIGALFFLAVFLIPESGWAQQPAPPYYSVQLQGLSSEPRALAELKGLVDVPYARAELREKFYLIRVGVYESPEEARKERDAFRDRGEAAARVVKIS